MPNASEARVVGAALVAFATGWAMLAFLTTRKTTRPQRWAYVPATVMATAGTVLAAVNPGEPAMTRLAWVWAPALVVLAVWVERRTRRDIPGRARLLVYPVTLAMLLAGLGGLYQATTKTPQDRGRPDARQARRRRRVPPAPELHRHSTGGPTVVLLNGLGETSPLWARVQPAVAATSRVCAYDRAGQGWSDDSSNPADATTAATDLHKLLTAAGETGPFVLAGHSSGGVHALTYTHLYPNDVAGVVLLDSASPRPGRAREAVQRRVPGHATRPRGRTHRVPVRGRSRPAAMGTPSLPGDAGAQVSAFANSPRGWANMRADQAALPVAFRQAQALTTLGRHPAGRADREGQRRRQARLGRGAGRRWRPCRPTPGTPSRTCPTSAFLTTRPVPPMTVTAIDDVVTATRTHAPLPTR